ncbi:MAG: hypothetical protein P4M12_05850, partial [Gammaproteobacteria bacterium]|nr:hypothetical protein [Gammaproteobacteria bacterium]
GLGRGGVKFHNSRIIIEYYLMLRLNIDRILFFFISVHTTIIFMHKEVLTLLSPALSSHKKRGKRGGVFC